jgi:hypothetical protein
MGEIVDAEALCVGKSKRCILLPWRDVEEDTIGNSDGTQRAKENHEYNGYGVYGHLSASTMVSMAKTSVRR